MMEELKPCPFCGCEATTRTTAADYFFIECGIREKINYATPCVHMSSVNTPDAIKQVIEKWNYRPIEDALHQAIDEMAIESIPMGKEEEVIAVLRADLARKDELIAALREVVKALEAYAETIQLNQYSFEEFNDIFARENLNKGFVAVQEARARLAEVEGT